MSREREEGGRSQYMCKCQLVLTHSVDKQGTLVWLLIHDFLVHHSRLYLMPQLQKDLPLQTESHQQLINIYRKSRTMRGHGAGGSYSAKTSSICNKDSSC